MARLKYNWLWFSLGVNAFIALGELVCVPVHVGGNGQDVLGYVNGTVQVLQMPGFAAADATGFRPRHAWTWRGFFLQVGVNLGFYSLVFGGFEKMRRRFAGANDPRRFGWERGDPPRRLGIRAHRATGAGDSAGATSDSSTREERPTRDFGPGNRPTRRNLLLGAGRLCGAAAAGVASWGLFVEPRWFEVTRRRIPIKGLPSGLSGLRIVQLSDIHHSTWMSIRWVRQIIDAANALAPDIVALTGDYIHRSHGYLRPVVAEMTRLKPRIGTVAVLGNHDWWEGTGALCREVFGEAGIPLIDNDRRFLTSGGKLVKESREGLCLAGVGDFWEDRCLYDAALAGVPGGMPRLLLSHNPDVAEEPDLLKSGHRVDLMLSGHTHGGQIALPFIGTPVTNSRFGSKYAKGLVQGPICPVFICKGLGMTVMPIRIGVRPEIAVLELVSA